MPLVPSLISAPHCSSVAWIEHLLNDVVPTNLEIQTWWLLMCWPTCLGLLLKLPKSFVGLYPGTGKQKYKYSRQKFFICLLLMLPVPWAAEITELIGPVTGTFIATFWSLGIFSCFGRCVHEAGERDWLHAWALTQALLQVLPACGALSPSVVVLYLVLTQHHLCRQNPASSLPTALCRSLQAPAVPTRVQT